MRGVYPYATKYGILCFKERKYGSGGKVRARRKRRGSGWAQDDEGGYLHEEDWF